MIQRPRVIGICALLAACLAVSWLTVPAYGQKLDMAIVWPAGNFHTQNAMKFAAEVKNVTGGEVEIIVHAGGALGQKGPELLRAVQNGTVPMAEFALVQQVGEEPLLGIEALPFLINDYDDLKRLYSHARSHIEKIFAKRNQKLLYLVPWPSQGIFTKVAVRTLSDLKGLKIRTTNKTSSELARRLGMTPVQLPFGDVVPALATGRLNAVGTGTSSAVDGKFWEFLKYMYRTNHFWASNVVSVNLDTLGKLKQEHRNAIVRLAAKLEPQFWDVSAAADVKNAKTLTANGLEIRQPSAALASAMRKVATPMWGQYAKSVGEPAGTILKQYRSTMSK